MALLDRLREPRIHFWMLAAIAVISFIAQLLAMHAPDVYGEPYLIARNIVHGKGFVFLYPYTFQESVTAYVPPLYAWLCVPFLASGLGETGIQIFNLLCLQTACFFIYRFFRPYTTANISLLIFAAVSFYIPFWALADALEPNALNILLLVLTVLCLANLSKRPSRKLWIAVGVLTGLQLLVRPDMLLGATLFSLWLIIVRRNQWLQIAKGIAIAALVAVAIVAPWTIRNYLTFHKFVLVSANSGMNLFTGNNPVATGEFRETGITPESERIYHQVLDYSKSHDQIEVDRLRWQIAMDWIKAHPMEAAALDLKKIAYHWIGRAHTGNEYRVWTPGLASDWMKNAYRIFSIVLIAFGAIGLFSQRAKPIRSLLLVVFLYSTIVSAIFFVQSRHRTLKVDPFLVPLATIGVVMVGARLPKNARS
ncbi:MAG: glycosyltransferase family 39 protein [Bacteroidota bacterium]|nr:glycosyltransferase family 39 protein [Bacteroidota bacterium]MDP4233939.1 glycosyltransferase family 39 protein [Bacteroidota bacterium]MDP4242810.1 glycosyltransferase family 39 protein [Bacteroidota bacterium]MDP4288288.1 glycosyltransferase family 39 protein [Bacteroidota bacterium]